MTTVGPHNRGEAYVDSGWIAAAPTGVNGYKFTDVGTPGPNLLCSAAMPGWTRLKLDGSSGARRKEGFRP
jgi:hypothetical protein